MTTAHLSKQTSRSRVNSRNDKPGALALHCAADAGLRNVDLSCNLLLRNPLRMDGAEHRREVGSNIFHESNHIPDNELTQALNEHVHLRALFGTPKLMTMDILIENVRNLMKAKRVSQEEFTAGIGMSQSWCSRFLSGEIKDPRRKTLEKIGEFFGVSYEYLTTGKSDAGNGDAVEVSHHAASLIGRIMEIDRLGELTPQLFAAITAALDLAKPAAPQRKPGQLLNDRGQVVMGDAQIEQGIDALFSEQEREQKKAG